VHSTGVVISQMSVFFPFGFFCLALPRPQKVVTSLLAFELFQGYLFSFVGYLFGRHMSPVVSYSV
jgi:hypothetical protein